MSPVRLLIDRMSPITRALVDEAVAECPNVCIVASDVAAADLAALVTSLSPDVVLLSRPGDLSRGDAAAALLGVPGLPGRVINLFEGSRGARVVEWRRSIRTVEPLSRASLCRALVGSDDADG